MKSSIRIFIIFTIAAIITFFTISAITENVKLRKELERTQTVSYIYHENYLKNIALKENPHAVFKHNSEKGSWDGKDKQKLQLIKKIAIGDSASNPNETFHKIFSVESDNIGNIYVTEYNSGSIKKFDSNGIYLFSIGKLGKGPSELGAWVRHKIFADSLIYIYDYSNYDKRALFTFSSN